MKSYLTHLSLVFSLTFWCACAPPAPEAPVAEPPATEGADLEAISQAGDDFVAAVLADDPIAFAACYTEDAVLMAPDGEAVTGRG